MTYTYRTASAVDNPQLKQLGIDSYTPLFNMLTQENRVVMQNFLNDDKKIDGLMKQSVCFVCEINNKIVGMAYFVPHGNAWDIYPNEWSYIRMVGVHPLHQGNGIAKKLTQLCIDEAIKNKEQIIALHTSEIMDAARHVYEKLGFSVLKEIDKRFGVRYFLYTLPLNKSSIAL